MSSALLRQSLQLVDSDLKNVCKDNKRISKKATDLIPSNKRVYQKVQKFGKKATKKELLHSSKKLTVAEARKQHKTKEEILRNNIRKLKQIREACKVNLDQEDLEKLIQRAVTRKPITKTVKKAKVEETAFTEEDFAKFEAEYFD